jgi:hypothetical protein
MTDHDHYGALPERLRRLGVDAERSCRHCGERRLLNRDDVCAPCRQHRYEDEGNEE